MQEPFDMDAFLNDLRDDDKQSGLSESVMFWATLHHLWKDHPLKIENSLGLGLVALSEGLAFDLSDVQYIRRGQNETYYIAFKSDPNTSLSIYPDTQEYTSLLVLMHLFNKQPEH